MKVRVRLATSSFQGKTFYALQNPQFRLLWFGNIFSFLGMQMQVIARGYLAFDLTGKNSALGGVMLAFGIPSCSSASGAASSPTACRSAGC